MIGLDLLGLAHPKFKIDAKQIPAGWAIGVFDDPFGPVLPKLRKLLQSGRFPVCRIQAHWATNHTICPIPKLKKKLPAYEKLAKDFPEIKIYVSHSCEYRESSKAKVKERVDLIRQLAPSCVPVNSCMIGATLENVISERHGDTTVKNGDIVSTDGINIYDIDAEAYRKRNKNAAITFLWGARFNLREITNPGQPVTPPMQRKAAPSPEYIASIVRLGTTKGQLYPMDSLIKKPQLLKTHAEDDQEDDPFAPDDPRENKPIVILKEKAEYVEIFTTKNQLLGKLIYLGTYDNGGHRYYAGLNGGIKLYGHQIARKAYDLSGSEFTYIKIKNKKYGVCNFAFREGFFQS